MKMNEFFLFWKSLDHVIDNIYTDTHFVRVGPSLFACLSGSSWLLAFLSLKLADWLSFFLSGWPADCMCLSVRLADQSSDCWHVCFGFYNFFNDRGRRRWDKSGFKSVCLLRWFIDLTIRLQFGCRTSCLFVW